MGSVYADLGAYFKVMGTGSNLKSFLGSVTPTVVTHIDDKRSSSSENTIDGVRYFHLVDLWNNFYEWSACGVSNPVRFPKGDIVDQCFVPYLSAIQLYASTDFSSQRVYQKKHEMTLPMSKSGDLCFQYFEVDSLNERMPLADKVYELSHSSPTLTSLDSTKLSPSSWISVLWIKQRGLIFSDGGSTRYPIGHIPQNSQEDLDTYFLTYHGLATTKGRVPMNSKGSFNRRMAVAPFGLATHEMDGVWISAGKDDEELVASLFDSAQSWLKKNDISHYDFNYFQNNNMVPPAEGCQTKAPDA